MKGFLTCEHLRLFINPLPVTIDSPLDKSLMHFACIEVAPPQLVMSLPEQSRGSDCTAGIMDKT